MKCILILLVCFFQCGSAHQRENNFEYSQYSGFLLTQYSIPLGSEPDPRASELLENSSYPRFLDTFLMLIEQDFIESPTNSVYRIHKINRINDLSGNIISQKEANDLYGIHDLNFSGDVAELTAEYLWKEKKYEIYSKEYIKRGMYGFGFWENFIAYGFIVFVNMLDIVSILSILLVLFHLNILRIIFIDNKNYSKLNLFTSVSMGLVGGFLGGIMAELFSVSALSVYVIQYNSLGGFLNIISSIIFSSILMFRI